MKLHPVIYLIGIFSQFFCVDMLLQSSANKNVYTEHVNFSFEKNSDNLSY